MTHACNQLIVCTTMSSLLTVVCEKALLYPVACRYRVSVLVASQTTNTKIDLDIVDLMTRFQHASLKAIRADWTGRHTTSALQCADFNPKPVHCMYLMYCTEA